MKLICNKLLEIILSLFEIVKTITQLTHMIWAISYRIRLSFHYEKHNFCRTSIRSLHIVGMQRTVNLTTRTPPLVTALITTDQTKNNQFVSPVFIVRI